MSFSCCFAGWLLKPARRKWVEVGPTKKNRNLINSFMILSGIEWTSEPTAKWRHSNSLTKKLTSLQISSFLLQPFRTRKTSTISSRNRTLSLPKSKSTFNTKLTYNNTNYSPNPHSKSTSLKSSKFSKRISPLFLQNLQSLRKWTPSTLRKGF